MNKRHSSSEARQKSNYPAQFLDKLFRRLALSFRGLHLSALRLGWSVLVRACTHKTDSQKLTWMRRPTSVIGGKADKARIPQYVR
jgi:hypothetical protein